MIKQLIIIALLSFLAYNAKTQTNNPSVKMLDVPISTFLTDSINNLSAHTKRVSIAGLKNIQMDELPGTIYTIDHEEIRLSGARDIMEILQLVPGISFGKDVDDVIGISMRGMWAHEGKYVIQINGLSLNETDFGTFAFSQRVPLDNVSRIEILLGPGTVIFGGMAALGVINIVTYETGENEGTYLTSQVSGGSNGIGRWNIGIRGNQYLGNQTSLSAYLYQNEGSKSMSLEHLNDSTISNNRDSTKTVNSEIFMNLHRKNLTFQFYRNDYLFDVKDASYKVNMVQTQFDVAYDKKLTTKTTLTSRISYGYFIPWQYRNATDPRYVQSNTTSRRIQASSNVNLNVSRKVQIFSGINAFYYSSIHDLQAYSTDSISLTQLRMMSGAAAFTDIQYKSKVGTIGVSARGEINSYVAPEIAPRFYYLFKKGPVYTKLSYSYSYKIPTIENINLGPSDTVLISEHGRTIDFSFGAKSKGGNWLQFSIYRNYLNAPIVYLYDEISLDNYANKGNMSSQGFEMNAGLKHERFTFKSGYSYYENIVKEGALPEVLNPHTKLFLAIPQHKVTALLGIEINSWLSWSATAVYQSGYKAYEPDENGESGMTLTSFAPSCLVNSFIHLQHIGFPFSGRIGASNILNSTYKIASPYNNGVASMQMDQRQIRLDLIYRITK